MAKPNDAEVISVPNLLQAKSRRRMVVMRALSGRTMGCSGFGTSCVGEEASSGPGGRLLGSLGPRKGTHGSASGWDPKISIFY